MMKEYMDYFTLFLIWREAFIFCGFEEVVVGFTI